MGLSLTVSELSNIAQFCSKNKKVMYKLIICDKENENQVVIPLFTKCTNYIANIQARYEIARLSSFNKQWAFNINTHD